MVEVRKALALQHGFCNEHTQLQEWDAEPKAGAHCHCPSMAGAVTDRGLPGHGKDR